MEKKILIDSDGVIRDFVKACEIKWGVIFDWSNDKKDVKDHLGLTTEQWESELENFKFWAEMQPTPEAKDLFHMLRKYLKREQIYIITSAQQTPCAISGYTAWYKKYLSAYKDRIIYIKDKTLLANKDTILIDDHHKTVSNFEKAGGWAILFPRPWNIHKKCSSGIYKIEIELQMILNINLEVPNAEEGILTLSS